MHRIPRALALIATWLLGGGIALFFFSLGFECWDVCPADYAADRLMRLTSLLLPGLLLGVCAWLASLGFFVAHARRRAMIAALLIPPLVSVAARPLLPLAAGGLPLSPAAIADDMLLWSALVLLILMIVLRRLLTRPLGIDSSVPEAV